MALYTDEQGNTFDGEAIAAAYNEAAKQAEAAKERAAKEWEIGQRAAAIAQGIDEADIDHFLSAVKDIPNDGEAPSKWLNAVKTTKARRAELKKLPRNVANMDFDTPNGGWSKR